jgi:hypothetical protein
MNLCSRRIIGAIGALAMICSWVTATAAETATSRIVNAANTFLSTFDDKQRQSVLFPFDDQKQRANWSNLPVTFVPRAGISLKDMNAAQRSAALALVSSALSQRGFEKVQQIIEGDEVLRLKEGNNPMFDKDLYYISILGKPSEKDPWMLQFGGHHLALNIIIAGERGVLTPTLTGAQPARYTSNGKTVRPLGQESDKAFALLNALDDGQKKQAILSYHLADLVLGRGQDGKTIQPEGLKASATNDRPRVMLLDRISEWVNIIHESAAAARMAELKADINETWFAWSGPPRHAPHRRRYGPPSILAAPASARAPARSRFALGRIRRCAPKSVANLKSRNRIYARAFAYTGISSIGAGPRAQSSHRSAHRCFDTCLRHSRAPPTFPRP